MSPVAVVTGATGFVASELVRQLVQKGYKVKGTVRSTSSSRAHQLIEALGSKYSAQLELHEADLLHSPEAFSRILSDSDYLFHVASPFVIDVADSQKQLMEPAVQGTRNVMLAAAEHKQTLKRIVLTSSVAAVHDCHCQQPPKNGVKYTEEDFNETSTLDKEAYWVSKVAAEKEAWRIAQEQGLPLVTILPEFILGPPVTAAAAQTSLSAGFIQSFLEATDPTTLPSGAWIISDVRDVAAAHILAATTPAASGRYIVSGESSISAKDITGFIKAAMPELSIPDGKDEPVKSNIDNSRAPRELGLQLTPAAQTIADAARALIKLGLVTVKHQSSGV